MKACRTLAVALSLGLLVMTLAVPADPVEQTLDRAKQRRQDDLARASQVYQSTIERANAAVKRTYETVIAALKRQGDESGAQTLSAEMEKALEDQAFDSTASDNKLLAQVLAKRRQDIAKAEAAFKASTARANDTVARVYEVAIKNFERKKDDARVAALQKELAAVKAQDVKPTVVAESDKPSKAPKGHLALIQSIGATMVNAEGKPTSAAAIGSKSHVLIYFSASWCGPCRAFTPDLVKFYEKHGKSKNFEVILVSSDRSEDAMLQYMKGDEMKWYAVPYDRIAASGLKQQFEVSGIPHLVLMDAAGNVVSSAMENGQYVGPRKVLADFEKLWR